jgi:hypothetical protein
MPANGGLAVDAQIQRIREFIDPGSTEIREAGKVSGAAAAGPTAP